MSYGRHAAIQDLERRQSELERRAPVSNVSQALLSLGIMLDERLEQISQAVGALALGTETVGKLTVHTETTEIDIVPIEAGDNPLLETIELADQSIAITVRRASDMTPAAQIRLTKLRALELGQHFVSQLACITCNGTGSIGFAIGFASDRTEACPRCNGNKVDPES